MMKLLVAAVLAAGMFAADSHKLSAAVSQIPSDRATAIKIGLVDNSGSQYLDGCGYSFWPVGKSPNSDPGTWKYLLLGNYDKKGWMNINDRVVELRLVENTIKYKGKKGDRYHQTYKSDDITVGIECVATGFGDTHAVDCDATITVVKGAQKQKIKAAGSCGC